MADKITIDGAKLLIETDEGKKVERPSTLLDDMYKAELLPLSDGIALPDGTKFIEHRGPLMLVAHQRPPHVRQARWIAPDSPSDYGHGTKYGKLRLSFPYSLTLALFQRSTNGQYVVTSRNELYFSNNPVTGKDSVVCYPGLLNVSVMKYGKRDATWICTQYLSATGGKPDDHWTKTLEHLLDHTWNGGFNLSSEHHEGMSWYGKYKGDKGIAPVENWQANTAKDDAFGLKVQWKPAGTVGEIMDAILTENAGAAAQQSVASRIVKFAKV